MLEKEKGFTLIEVVVTVVIMGIIIAPLANLFNLPLIATVTTKEQMVANQLAQQYIENIKSIPYAELKKMSLENQVIQFELDETTVEEDELITKYGFSKPMEGYRAEITITPDLEEASEEVENSYERPDTIRKDEESGGVLEIISTALGEYDIKYIEMRDGFKNEVISSVSNLEKLVIKCSQDGDILVNSVKGEVMEEVISKTFNRALPILKIATSEKLELEVFNDMNLNDKPVILTIDLYDQDEKSSIEVKEGNVIKVFNQIIEDYLLYKVIVEVYKEEKILATLTASKTL